MRKLTESASKYPNIKFESLVGILQVRLHTNGESLTYGPDRGGIREQLGQAFVDIARDPVHRVVILTGTGTVFLTEFNREETTESIDAAKCYATIRETKDMLMNFLNIGVPVIGVINGPAAIHAELPLLGDIVLAASDAALSDCHLRGGIVPGDGAHVVWDRLLGHHRARQFFYTENELSAREALALGIVGEVLERDQLLLRAWQIAERLALKPLHTLRHMRALLTQPFKKALLADLGHGLALECLGITQTSAESR
jgi:enoyl-CoA hydratase/carnithine racemase